MNKSDFEILRDVGPSIIRRTLQDRNSVAVYDTNQFIESFIRLVDYVETIWRRDGGPIIGERDQTR